MKLSKEEKAADRALFKSMPFRKKVGHIWYYHKWKIIFGMIVLGLIGSSIYQVLTKKDPVLYLGMMNVSVSYKFEERITTDYLNDAGRDPDREEVFIYHELYLSEDAEGEQHKSVYASRIKLMASVEKQEFDAVLMSRQAYDILSAQGYLMPLETLTAGDPALQALLAPVAAENEVYLEDNAIDYELNVDESHEIVSETVANAVLLNSGLLFSEAGFQDPIYFGVIGNSPRTQACIEYLEYLLR